MRQLIHDAVRGMEHVLHLGDMVVAEMADVTRGRHGTTRVVRGLYIGTCENEGVILLRRRSGDITARRSSRPMVISDDDFTTSECDWIPGMRNLIRDASRATFEVPGLPSITEDLMSSVNGTLECIEAPDSTPERQRWVIFHDREPIGVCTRGSLIVLGSDCKTYTDLRKLVADPLPVSVG